MVPRLGMTLEDRKHHLSLINQELELLIQAPTWIQLLQ